MIGFPQKYRMFFRGIRLLPPLAGMTATFMECKAFFQSIRLMSGQLVPDEFLNLFLGKPIVIFS